SPHERRRSRSRERRSRDDRRRRDERDKHAQGGGELQVSSRSATTLKSIAGSDSFDLPKPVMFSEPISLDQLVNCEQDISTLMGFTGFNTTKNKKVHVNYDGAVKINKPRRYRQYMNRKGGFNRPLDYIAEVLPTMTNCIGSVISVDCGEFGYYQGRLISLDAESKDIVLGSAFKEGIPLGKNVTLNGAQIVSLKVLKPAQQVAEAHKKDVQKSNGVKQNGSIVHRSKSTIEFSSMDASSQNRNRVGGLQARSSTTMQSKPIRAAVQRKPSSVSSTSEEGQNINPDVSSKARRRSRRVRRSESEHIHSHPLGVSETPHFRSFEPQVPLPREVLVAKVKNRGKTKGPSGNPLLDSKKLHGRIANGNDELVKPIDFDLLNTDFDFDANLEQFKRENEEDEYYETVEKQKMSQNFAHYENIIADPTRVTSWTNVLGGSNHIGNSDQTNATTGSAMERRSPPTRSISFCPSGYETTYDGFPLPVLDVALKKKYLSECCSAMGSDVYYYMVADRLIMWLIDVVGRLGITLDRTVVLASSTTPLRLVDRILSHLDNRGLVFSFSQLLKLLFAFLIAQRLASPSAATHYYWLLG
ncbi:hypothetical protein COOONC_22311, partial [Cooperia oncophora]